MKEFKNPKEAFDYAINKGFNIHFFSLGNNKVRVIILDKDGEHINTSVIHLS